MSNLATSDESAIATWNASQIEIIKNQIAKGCSDAELQLFGQVCQKTGLDPFSRQIYAIVRNQYNSDTRQKEPKMTIQLSIDGFRTVAARSGLYGGSITEWCGDDGIWRDVWLNNKPPSAAKTTVYRKGCQHSFTGVARFESYAPIYNGKVSGLWEKMPDLLIGKCLPGRAEVETNLGILKIRDIVNKRLHVKVRSINLDTLQEEWKSVVAWHCNGSTSDWIQLKAPNGIRGNKHLTLTKEHPILTPNGWVETQDLSQSDNIAVASPALSVNQIQVLLGSLLGNGSLSKSLSKNSVPHFSQNHCIEQLEYALWKQRCFSNLNPVVKFATANNPAQSKVVKLRTLAYPCLHTYQKSFYKKNRKQASSKILNQLDDLGVAVWLMDDGSIKSTNTNYSECNPFIRLYACAFENQECIIDFFKSRYGVNPKILRPKKNPYIMFSVEDSAIMLEKLSKFIEYDTESNTKKWLANEIKVGYCNSFVFVPITSIDRRVKSGRKGRGNYVSPEEKYDIEVEDNHNFLYNNVIVHNCSESLALRKAFPAELSGFYSSEEMQQADGEGVPTKSEVPQSKKTAKYSEDIKVRQQALRECMEILKWTPEYKTDWIKTISLCPLSAWDIDLWDLAVAKALAAINELGDDIPS